MAGVFQSNTVHSKRAQPRSSAIPAKAASNAAPTPEPRASGVTYRSSSYNPRRPFQVEKV